MSGRKVRLWKMIAVAALAAAASSCAHRTPPQQKLDGYGWFMQPETDGAKLAYGAPNSDVVVLMMRCRRGAPDLSLSLSSAPDWAASIDLASNRARQTFPGAKRSDELSGAVVEATAKSTDDVFQRFRTSGELTVAAGRRRMDISAQAAEKPQLQRFFAACA